ncbi:hypothetical protein ACFORJ_07765 [Corynebacterium hansenii]|uniref:RelA/SpoT domain-containing protein n=1 Tax=Corynebacterium hansenii TaxID=394964 RepID=A0ABV7ZPH0_9CORY|nr:hypothetical protein [Corynebacterium hansenii]WJZ00645.1 hypothetical protein CHAN_10220 [Corynebacterium hansenii]
MLGETFPHSNNQLKKLGKALKYDSPHDVQLYQEWMTWNAELLATVWLELDDCLESFVDSEPPPPFEAFPPLTKDSFELSGRVKTEDTTREKLRRNTTSLNGIQDIVGLRIDAPMRLSQQSRLADHIAGTLQAKGASVAQRDLRDGSHCGYRAVHLHATFPAGRTEIQLRTTYQSTWANLYEVLGDVVGREIRYKQEFSPEVERAHGPIVRKFWRASEALHKSDTEWNDWVSSCEELMLDLHKVPEPYPDDLQAEIDKIKERLTTAHESREEARQRLSRLADTVRRLPPANRQEGVV